MQRIKDLHEDTYETTVAWKQAALSNDILKRMLPPVVESQGSRSYLHYIHNMF